MEKVSFKSREPFFSKEADGRKPNTFRQDDPLDQRFAILALWMKDKSLLDNSTFRAVADEAGVGLPGEPKEDEEGG